MNVAELMEFLQQQPMDMPVVVECFSEQLLLTADSIDIRELCEPRDDGWVPNQRPDKKSKMYLVIPGN